jgi:hypothetical protein
MKISRKEGDSDFEQWRDWHVLTISKVGLSALDIYARGMHGVDTETINKFAAQIDRNDEVGSLYPKAPVSAIPWRYFGFIEEFDFPNHMDDFGRHIKEFIELNRTKINARRILVDFHRDSDPVPDVFLKAAEEVFKEYAAENEIDEIVLLK